MFIVDENIEIKYKDLFTCDNCKNFTDDGYCTVLKFGCNFEEKD